MSVSVTTNCRVILPWLTVILFTISCCPMSSRAQDCSEGDWLSPLPSLGTFYSTSNYSDGGLGILIDWANGFIDVVQPNELPYQLIRDAINGTLEDRYEEDSKAFILEGLNYMAGFVACLLIGILYILILPIVCLCFCCCRCCGNCGGKRVQKVTKYSTCKRVYFSISLLIITIIMGFGVACTSLSNDWVSESSGEIYDSYTYILDDVVTFLDGSVNQLEHIATCELGETTDRVFSDLDDRGTRLGVPIQEYINTTIEPVFEELDTFSATLDEAIIVMEKINVTVLELQENATLLADELDMTATKLQETLDACGASCDGIETSVLTVGMNFTDLPSLEDDLQKLKDLLNEDFANHTEKAKEAFEGIPDTIDEQTESQIEDLKETVNELEQTVEDAFGNVTDKIDEFYEVIDDIKGQSQEYWDIIKQYDDYRYYTVIGLTCLTLLIVIFNIAGLSMGLCGTKRDAHPMERTRLSNAGGNILMAGVAFSFFFSWLLILIVMIMFFVLGNLGQLCEPLHTLEAWEETIDYPYLIQEDGYLLGEAVLGNASINLTVSGFLTDCQKDKSLYSAAKLEYLIDLTELTEYRDKLDLESKIKELIDDIDLSELTVFPEELEDTLLEFKNTLRNLSLDEYKDVLDGNITEVNLLEYADELYEVSATLTDDAISASLNESAANLTRIHYQYVEPMEAAVEELLQDIDRLETLSLALQNSTDDLIEAFKNADEQITSNDTLVVLERVVLEYSDLLLSNTDEYVNYAVNQVTVEFARCRPVRTVYDSIVIALCNYAIDSLHLIWFTLGWCMFFYIPSIIFAVKLAKYYRIMTSEPKTKAKKSKKKKKNKNEVEDLAMKQMDGTAEMPPYGGLDHVAEYNAVSGPPPRTNHPRAHYYYPDTNHLIHSQGHGAAAAANYNTGPQTNPHYIHDEPIMAYDNPRGGQPPPYNAATSGVSSQQQRHKKRASSSSKPQGRSYPRQGDVGQQESSKYPKQRVASQYPKQPVAQYPKQPVAQYPKQTAAYPGNQPSSSFYSYYPGNQISQQPNSLYVNQRGGYYGNPQQAYQRSSSYASGDGDYLMPYEPPQSHYYGGLYNNANGYAGYGARNIPGNIPDDNWSFGAEPQQGRQKTDASFSHEVNHLY
ncbi:prominin-1-A-like isoform X4 [Ptychodera flava]|uniref:prominin-1-A-like isoform X4 n=1 Tax=Ptychodera flava TaxID=63121 RepID=UPI003969D340